MFFFTVSFFSRVVVVPFFRSVFLGFVVLFLRRFLLRSVLLAVFELAFLT